MVSDGKEFYEVRGFPLYANHSYFDPRKDGYTLFAGELAAGETDITKKARARQGGAKGKAWRREKAIVLGSSDKEMWQVSIPITGKAMAMAGDVLFVAGEPMKFDEPTYQKYVAAYNGQTGREIVGRVRQRRQTVGGAQAESRPGMGRHRNCESAGLHRAGGWNGAVPGRVKP